MPVPPCIGNHVMKMQGFVVTPSTYGPALDVLGTRVTVLASNLQTQSYEVTLQRGDEGTGPPLHSHDWDESFFVLKGMVEFSCDDKTSSCAPGTLVHVPANTVHGFRYGAGGGEMLEFSGPGGRATRMFAAISNTVSPGPPDIPLLLKVLSANGVSVAA